MTATVWSNKIFGLASFRRSANQTVPHVLDADVGDSGEGGRGALMPRFGSLRIGANGRVQSVLGFVSCLSGVDRVRDALG